MLGGFVSYLLQIDRKTWTAFRNRLKREGRKVGVTLHQLIEQYIRDGMHQPPPPKE